MATTASLPSEESGALLGSRLEECGDETLAHLVAEADEAAFAALYERHYQALYRYCRSIVRHDSDAQDAVQSAWARAFVALRHGRRDAPLRPWLYRIVHNEAISLLRRRRRDAQPADALAQGDPALATLPGAPSAEEAAIARERFALLMADLDRLPDRPRGALLMRELSGLTHEEIADALETSVAAAKQCVYEARRDLADLAAGRATPCDEICRSISAGDRRVLRGRRVKAHLNHCPSCSSFASAIDQRRQALHAMLPWLVAPAAITLLDRVLRAGSGPAAKAGAGMAGGSAGAAGPLVGGSAGAAGPIAAAGTAAPAAVAGGVVTKVLSVSLLTKAVVATAAVTAGVVSLGVAGARTHRTSHPSSPQAVRPAASPSLSAHAHAMRRPAAPQSPAGTERSKGSVRPATGTPRPHHANREARGALAPTPPAKHKAPGALLPGQAKKASSGSPGPGQAKKASSGSVSPGHAKKAVSGSVPPGHAKKAASGSVPPGHAKEAASGSVPPGQAKIPPGEAKKASSGPVPPGQAKKAASGSVPPGQAKKALTTVPASEATPAPAAASPASSSPDIAGASSPGKSGAAHAK